MGRGQESLRCGSHAFAAFDGFDVRTERGMGRESMAPARLVRRGPTSLLGPLKGPEYCFPLGRLVEAGGPLLVLALVDANDQRFSVPLVDCLVYCVFTPLAYAFEVQQLRIRGRVDGDDLPGLNRPEGPLRA